MWCINTLHTVWGKWVISWNQTSMVAVLFIFPSNHLILSSLKTCLIPYEAGTISNSFFLQFISCCWMLSTKAIIANECTRGSTHMCILSSVTSVTAHSNNSSHNLRAVPNPLYAVILQQFLHETPVPTSQAPLASSPGSLLKNGGRRESEDEAKAPQHNWWGLVLAENMSSRAAFYQDVFHCSWTVHVTQECLKPATITNWCDKPDHFPATFSY